MDERKTRSVEIEAACRRTVESIAENRNTKACGMSAVHAKLMGATGDRMELNFYGERMAAV